MLDPANLTGDAGNSTPAFPLPSASVPAMPEPVAADSPADAQVRTMAAVVELVCALDVAESLDQAAAIAVRRLAAHLSAQRVIALWRDRDQQPFAVIADTARDDGEMEVPQLHRLAEAAAEETAARGARAQWPTESAVGRHALLALAQLARAMGASVVKGIRLGNPTDHQTGVLLVIGQIDQSHDDFLSAISLPLAGRLAAVERMAPTALETALRNIISFGRSRRRNLAIAIAVSIAVLLALPLRYTVRSGLELQPVEHRFVAVPFDGPLQAAHVRPGDTVRQGDLLATINPREIEYELAGIRAELNRAVQEKKGMMAEHDSAGSKIAALESERLRLKSELLQYRRGNLEIRSPIDGVVVSGDLKQSEGMPLSRGDTLFEIAPLGELVVELAVKEDDFAHVRPGMPAEFYVHALPSRRLRGTVDRIHPSAELRDHDNVFIAEIRLTDPENVLRPGMKGRAKIASDRHPLGWNLFHKSYYALRRAAGW